MKKLFLLLIVIASIAKQSFGQNDGNIIRCAASDHYTQLTPDGDKRTNKACSICYTDQYFSFYIPELGARSFDIDDATRSRKISKDGTVTDFFDSEDGGIAVQVEYGHPSKTFVINFTRFGNAYLIQTNGFLGSSEISKNVTAKQTKANLEKIKADKTKRDSINKTLAIADAERKKMLQITNRQKAIQDSLEQIKKQEKEADEKEKQEKEQKILERNKRIEALPKLINSKHEEFEKLYVEKKNISQLATFGGLSPQYNSHPKGKHIYEKSEQVYQESLKLFDSEKDSDKKIAIGNDIVKLLERLIFLASTNTKGLNKTLKKTEANEEIKKILGL